MATVTIHIGAKPRLAHPERLLDIMTDINNPELRRTILHSKRFAERITDLLLQGRAGVIPPPPTDPALKRLSTVLGEVFLSRLGQLWFAPILAEHVISPKGRIWPGLNDRHILRLVVKYRNHAPSNAIGPIPSAPDFMFEGVKCVSIWLEQHEDRQVAGRLALTLPPQSTAISGADFRLSLLDRVLADPDVTEGLKNV